MWANYLTSLVMIQLALSQALLWRLNGLIFVKQLKRCVALRKCCPSAIIIIIVGVGIKNHKTYSSPMVWLIKFGIHWIISWCLSEVDHLKVLGVPRKQKGGGDFGGQGTRENVQTGEMPQERRGYTHFMILFKDLTSIISYVSVRLGFSCHLQPLGWRVADARCLLCFY